MQWGESYSMRGVWRGVKDKGWGVSEEGWVTRGKWWGVCGQGWVTKGERLGGEWRGVSNGECVMRGEGCAMICRGLRQGTELRIDPPLTDQMWHVLHTVGSKLASYYSQST